MDSSYIKSKEITIANHKNKLNTQRFHSINFDSVQQRKALLGKNGYLNYLRLNAILKLQILLSKKLVLSDAQIYDGLFFFWMAELDELNDFLRCGEEADFLEIRVRDNKVFPVNMFMKPFICSAIELKELSDCIYDITSNMLSKSTIENFNNDTRKILEKRCIKEDKDSPEEYLDKVGKIISNIYCDMYEDEWNTYQKRLQLIYNGIKMRSRNLVKSWDKDTIIMESEDCNKILEKLNELIKKENDTCYCNHIFSNMIRRVESKHCKRSEFVGQCEQLSVKCKDTPDALKLIKELLTTFDVYYNQSIARNMKCETIYDITLLDNVTTDAELDIKKELLWNLANLTWDEFNVLYTELEKSEYTNLSDRLIFISNYTFKTITDSNPIPENGPWNYKKTFKYTKAYVTSEDMSFINEEGINSDSMYIWYSNTTEPYKMTFQLKLS